MRRREATPAWRLTSVRLASLCAVALCAGALTVVTVLRRTGVAPPADFTLLQGGGGRAAATSTSSFAATTASCTPAFPHVLVYTRVPKTGSSSLRSVIDELARSNNFTVSPGSFRSVEELRAAIDAALASPTRTVIVWHAPFAGDAPALRDGRVAYFSMLRDPVAQCVSSYYYHRWLAAQVLSQGQQPDYFRPLIDTINVTLDACLAPLLDSTAGASAGALQPAPWPLCLTCGPQAAYFCESPELRAPNGPALGPVPGAAGDVLRTAMRTTEAHYRVVGLVESLADTVDVLERVYPRFFAGGGTVFRSFSADRSHSNSHKSPGRLWSPASPETLAELAPLLAHDTVFYARTRARFHALHSACAIPPRPSPSSHPRARASCAQGDFLHDWDVPGASSELRSLSAGSPDACCSACVDDAACAAWVWRGDDCWLKASARTLQRSTGGVVAGYVRDLA